MIRRLRPSLALLALGVGATAVAAQDVDWRIPTGNLRTAPALEQVARAFPDSAAMQRRILSAAHQSGDAARVVAALQRLADMGYVPSDATLATLAPHLTPEVGAALRLRFAQNRREIAASRIESEVPAEHRLVEGIARDAQTGRLFAGTVVSRSLLVNEGGQWRALSGIDAGSLFGLAIDPARRLLWMASGRVEQTPDPASAFRGLIALNLDTLAVVRRVPVAGEGSPADIAVAGDGTVYAGDPQSGALYAAATGDSEARIFVPAGRFANPQGIVAHPDGRFLYVADYLHGIALVDRASGAVSRLPSVGPAMLDGIDGLAWHQGSLLAIQNGTAPKRILHLTLIDRGRRLLIVRRLEQARWGEAEPTLGFVDGHRFLYVADAQWESYGEAGAVRTGAMPRATAIRAISLAIALPPRRSR